MKINRFNYKQFSDSQILDAVDTGSLVVEGVGFLERIVILITKSIEEKNTKWKKRLAQLEKNSTEMQAALNFLAEKIAAGALEFSQDKLADLPIEDEVKDVAEQAENVAQNVLSEAEKAAQEAAQKAQEAAQNAGNSILGNIKKFF